MISASACSFNWAPWRRKAISCAVFTLRMSSQTSCASLQCKSVSSRWTLMARRRSSNPTRAPVRPRSASAAAVPRTMSGHRSPVTFSAYNASTSACRGSSLTGSGSRARAEVFRNSVTRRREIQVGVSSSPAMANSGTTRTGAREGSRGSTTAACASGEPHSIFRFQKPEA